MQLNPHLVFNGQCEEAFKLYEKVLNGRIETMLPYAGTPVEKQVPPEWRHKVIHATLVVDGQLFMGADAPPDHYQKPQGFSVAISLKDPAEGERIYNALVENGRVQMPMQKTFWAERFGMLVDRYGIPWMINCGQAA